MNIFSTLDEYFEEYEPDDLTDGFDEDYFRCSECNLIMLKSSNPDAIENRCCEDCFIEIVWQRQNNQDKWW